MRVRTVFLVTALMTGGCAAALAAPRSAIVNKSVQLSEVMNPTETLDQPHVQDAKGVAIGQVQRVVTSEKTGTVARIDVALQQNPQKVVSLSSDQLRYVPFDRTLHASLPAEQIKALPAAAGGASP